MRSAPTIVIGNDRVRTVMPRTRPRLLTTRKPGSSKVVVDCIAPSDTAMRQPTSGRDPGSRLRRVWDDATASLYRLRVDRRSGSAGHDERGTAEEEFVDSILLAVLGQFLEVENFPHAQPHGRDHDPMPGLVGFLGFIRPHFHAPGVRADCRELFLLAPVAILKLDAGRI